MKRKKSKQSTALSAQEKILPIWFPFKESKPKKTVLWECLRNFSLLTGMEICFYDMSFFTYDIKRLNLPEEIKIHKSPLCQYVKSSLPAHKECRRIEYRNLKRCFLQHKSFILYRCHAGLSQLVIPLALRGKLMGGVAIGQVYVKSNYRKDLKKLSRRYRLNFDKLISMAKSTPLLEKSKLYFAFSMGKLIAEYVIEELNISRLTYRLMKAGKETNEISRTQDSHHAEMFDVPLYFLDFFENLSPPIKSAIDLIRQRYRESITRKEMASIATMSESTFARRLKKETGMSFKEIIKKTKLSAAVYLLKRSHFNVSEIAGYLGYGEISSFSKAFKAGFGCSPLAYIRRPI